MTSLCGTINPKSPLLVLDVDRLDKGGSLAERLAKLTASAVRMHGLSLIPIIAIGHGEGANLTAELALSHGSLLAACILLKPYAQFDVTRSQVLNGIHVLLARVAAEKSVGTNGWRLRRALTASGALVVCERVMRHQLPSSYEAALSRVFIAALFGA